MTHTRSNPTPRTRHLFRTVLPLVGMTAAATIAAGPAAAESLSRAGETTTSSTGGNNRLGTPELNGHTGGDTTGIHKIDPYGYSHTDSNPLRQNEHRAALRESRTPPPQSAPRISDEGNSSATWQPVTRDDGSGWTVCRPHAAQC